MCEKNNEGHQTNNTPDEKYENLLNLLKNLKSVVVAFSGGVDSSVVAYAAYKILGKNAVAVTIDSFVMPRKEIICAKKIAKEIGISHIVVRAKENKGDENFENFLKNPVNRCYFCKKHDIEILKHILKSLDFNLTKSSEDFVIAKKYNIEAIADGTNADDLKDTGRFGIKALREENVISPLAEVGLTKQEIREIAGKIGLTNAEKPSMACLASRIPVNESLTKERLKRIEKAENLISGILRAKRAKNLINIRVRDHKNIARLECNAECIELIIKNRNNIANALKNLNYEYVVLDLEGYSK